jgi:hypothetical protein
MKTMLSVCRWVLFIVSPGINLHGGYFVSYNVFLLDRVYRGFLIAVEVNSSLKQITVHRWDGCTLKLLYKN